MRAFSRDDALMEMAVTVSKLSTCSRLPVGAIISRDGRTLSSGYNGAPARLPHCDHSCNCRNPLKSAAIPPHDEDCRSRQACRTAVHAELNAISFAAKYGTPTDSAVMHCTHMPCLNCAMAIINSGIAMVSFLHPYRDLSGYNLLKSAGVHVGRVSLYPQIGE